MQTRNFKIIAITSLLMAGASLFAGSAIGGSNPLGTRFANVPSAMHPARSTKAPNVRPANTYANAQYATGGVALRNRSVGVIHVSGAVTPIQDAWLYFTYLYSSTPPASLKIKLTRLFPGPTSNVNVVGKLIAQSADPCWDSSGGAIYKAQVPTTFANDNGAYEITVPAGVVGLNSGEDPWDGNVVYPLDEGASLVLIGSGSSAVDIFDKGMAGSEFSGSYAYTLKLSSAASNSVLMDSIGADGQIGDSRASGLTGETVTVNGVQISGPGSTIDTDSDWDGSSGWPLPQLWDDVGHDITAAAPSGTTSLAVAISSPDDCLITVSNVVSH